MKKGKMNKANHPKKEIIIGSVIILVLIFFLCLKKDEDTWIRDNRGIWIKHGMPDRIPQPVEEQKEIINCAINLYDSLNKSNVKLDSQCLGNCEEYAVDLVHNPSAIEDNLPENQCKDYLSGNLTHFVELDIYGKIVRIT